MVKIISFLVFLTLLERLRLQDSAEVSL